MLKYPCLVLDHDDTVVQSEATVNYPCFCHFLKQYRPGTRYTFEDYVADCSRMSFVDMCRIRFSMTEEELYQEYLFWKAYMKEHIPEPFSGIGKVLHAYRKAGGKICVVSMSSEENILRDYRAHFGFDPDLIFGCDLPEELRKPSTYPLEQIQSHFNFSPAELLVIDDMKFAVPMAKNAACPIAFAGWGRKEFPTVCREMEDLCDYAFYSPDELEKFLFD
jgi:phosphoglycolate phosphatase/pyrophosphatase PpaX